jgi:hypothetical protein
MTKFGADIYKVLCVDKLHEWDGGKVKDFVSQIMRILYSLKGDSVSALNRRYVHIDYHLIYNLTNA